jgi:L-seryl-tRNA(Ser) seleniumtransferase
MAMQPRARRKKPEKRANLAGIATAGRLRAIPAVARVQSHPEYEALTDLAGCELAADLVREELERVRELAKSSASDPPGFEAAVAPSAIVARALQSARELLAPSPRVVVNATGVVVHTNLGRSILSQAAAERVAEAATRYMDLELDLGSGSRGSRLAHLTPLLARLFPGAASAAFNNNAAATLLTLRALAQGKEVVVSRGELVEIGGSFRIPDILAASGATLREVGTTNRTRLADYRNALTKRTGLLLKVHPSNFKVVGFTEETGIAELAALARKAKVPLAVDWGSGDIADLAAYGIQDEIPVRAILAAGADVVTFSADKLLGGPQAGIVVGKPKLVERIRKDPLARVCRLDRLAILALRETLAAYVCGRAAEEVPTLRMIAEPAETIERRAFGVRRKVEKELDVRDRIAIVDGVSRTGGGSSPVGQRPTRLLALRGRAGDAAALEKELRRGDPPVLARIQDGRLLIDLRTVLPGQDDLLAECLVSALRREGSG